LVPPFTATQLTLQRLKFLNRSES